MKIALIRPRTGNTPDPPLGLMILAACLKSENHEVRVFDPGLHIKNVTNALEGFSPDLIGYSLLTTQVARAREMQTQLRLSFPNAITCAGGIHATALPEWTVRNLNLDFVVIGEGEVTFPEAVRALEAHRSLECVHGVGYLSQGNYIRTPPRELIQDLDRIPLPDRNSIDFNRYLRPPGNIRGKFLKRATSLITSRGCPFGCIFCSSHGLFGRKVRRRSIDHVMHEIEELIKEYRIDGLWFLDDTLLEDPQWLSSFCEAIGKTHLPWGCQAHVRRADESLFRKMKASGCLQLEFGVESGSEKILARLRKGSSPDDVRRAFAICKKLKIRTLANFMIGIPDETISDARQSLALAREIQPDHVVVTFTTPLPGSDLYTEADLKAWLPQTPDFSDKWTIRQTETPLIACSMDANSMIEIRRQFDNAFFWKNIQGYFGHPGFVLHIAFHIVTHPFRYLPGLTRAIRTGRMSHLIEVVWEEFNRV